MCDRPRRPHRYLGRIEAQPAGTGIGLVAVVTNRWTGTVYICTPAYNGVPGICRQAFPATSD
jgi:hypothetical protein